MKFAAGNALLMPTLGDIEVIARGKASFVSNEAVPELDKGT
jgi:hypothetical protein